MIRHAKTAIVLAALATITMTYAPSRASADMHDAIHDACDAGECGVTDLQREETGIPGQAHYSATLQVGPGTNDVIGIHRVTKENAPWVPKASSRAVLLVHGDVHDFTTAFLMGPVGASTSSSVSAYLAANNVDVWGIDLRWTKVAGTTADFSFMQSWNLETDARDTRIALAVARVVRGLTGSGFGRMKLGGHSRGGQIAYVVAQQETLLSQGSPLRSVNGLVILDVPLKTDNEAFRQGTCAGAAQLQAQIDAGIYADGTGTFANAAGELAAADPSGPSPLFPSPPFPPLTNRQAMLAIGGATYLLAPSTPSFHWVGSTLGPDGLPTGFLFVDENAFIQTLRSVPPFESSGTVQQGLNVVCTSIPALDGRLQHVTVPVLYVGASGGFGELGYYTTSLLGSTDVELMTVGVTGNPYTEFGHDDLLRANNAQSLAWDPIRVWLQTH